MRCTTISLDNLEQFLMLEKHKVILQEKLQTYLKEQELQLKRLKTIKSTSQYLRDHKGTEWWNSIGPEFKKELDKWRDKK